MRDAYHEELDHVTELLVEMTKLVGGAIRDVGVALLDVDIRLADRVIAGDDRIDAIYREVEERSFDLLARQQPVASDLRRIVTSLRIVVDLERAGDYARHLAKLARRRFPAAAIPPELHDTFAEMSAVAERLVHTAGRVIRNQDIAEARALLVADDEMDALHRRLFTIMLAPDWPYGVDTAIDIALAGRYFERYADHAVAVARRVVYLVTGERMMAS